MLRSNPAVAEAEDLAGRYIPSAYLRHHPVLAVSADGPWIEDADGRRYIDFAGGIGVLNAGHRHPEIVAAVGRQLDELMHTGPVMLHAGYAHLSARIAQRVDPTRDMQVLLVNSGAEAVENAVKVARHATERSDIISFRNSFHGRTMLTSTLNGKTSPYKSQPGGMAPEIHHAPFPDPFRPPVGVAQEALADHCIDALERLLAEDVPASKVAAIIVEPIQGEGGYIVPPDGFLPMVRDLCDRIGALLIVDEIQSGYWRTGRFLACEWENIRPDVVTLGKSLGGGLPIAAVVAPADVFDRVVPGDIGGTYGGNPLACAAGLAVLDLLESADLPAAARSIEHAVRGAIDPLIERYDQIAEVRGRGGMLAVELVTDPTTKHPATALAHDVIVRAREDGVIVIKTGAAGNVVRILPSLLIEPDALSLGLERLVGAIQAACTMAEGMSTG